MPNDNITGVDTTGQTWYSFNEQGQYQSLGVTDISAARLAASGLYAGAASSVRQTLNVGFSYGNGTAVDSKDDWRVRVSCSDSVFGQLFSGPLTVPLRPGQGVTFPFTPQVSVTHNARYGSQQLTHSNYASFFYEGSEVQAITINGDFTVQNAAEGQYLLAAIYFFRAVSKMFFGQDQLAGCPPPMVFLDGYGSHYFSHVPCVLTSMTHTMPSDVDYVEFPVVTSLQAYVNQAYGTNLIDTTRLPTTSQIQITLQPIYSRANVHNNFTLRGFAEGNLLGGPRSVSGIPGGFI